MKREKKIQRERETQSRGDRQDMTRKGIVEHEIKEEKEKKKRPKERRKRKRRRKQRMEERKRKCKRVD